MTVLDVRIYNSAGVMYNTASLVSAFYCVLVSSRYRRALRVDQIGCIAVSV